MLAPIGVALVAVAVLVVIATSVGGDSNGDTSGADRGNRGQRQERSGEKFYVVEPGDTLTTISQKTGVGVNKLTRLNPDLDPQALISGQRVKLR